MTLDAIVRAGLLFSIWLMVFSLGVRATLPAAGFLLRRPVKFAQAMTAMFIVVPAFAIALAWVTSLPGAIKFAIVAMSVGPLPPILPFKQMKAGGEEGYSIGLLVAASLAAILLTPWLVAVATRLLGTDAEVEPMQVARTLLLTIALPLLVGMALRAAKAPLARRAGGVAQRVGSVALLAVFVAMLVDAGGAILELLGNGAALAIAAMVAVGLAAGHLLAGPHHRAPVALAAASRHPGVALAIASQSYPDQLKSITAAILLYLLVTGLISAPYVRWASGRAAPLEPAAGPAAQTIRSGPDPR